MNEELKTTHQEDPKALSTEIGAQATLRLKAQKNKDRGVWMGLGMMGIVGWSVVVPTLLGAALGMWLDQHHPGTYSWTLTLLLLGLVVGCLNAWHWVSKENKNIGEDQDDE